MDAESKDKPRSNAGLVGSEPPQDAQDAHRRRKASATIMDCLKGFEETTLLTLPTPKRAYHTRIMAAVRDFHRRQKSSISQVKREKTLLSADTRING